MQSKAEEILDEILEKILEPLRLLMIVGNKGWLVACSDGNVRRCFPILAARLADIPKKGKIMGLKKDSFVNCEAAVDDYGDYPLGGIRQKARNMKDYVDGCRKIVNPNESSSSFNNVEGARDHLLGFRFLRPPQALLNLPHIDM